MKTTKFSRDMRSESQTFTRMTVAIRTCGARPFRRALLAALAMLVCAPLSAATYRNPVLPGDYPDPSVIRVGEDYWATATTSEPRALAHRRKRR